MADSIPAPFAKQTEYFRRSLAGLRAGGCWAGVYLYETIMALLAVEVAATRDGTPTAEVDAFRQEVSVELDSLVAQVRNYVELVADEAETDGDDIWEGLCGKRSAIEVLLTLYAHSAATKAILPDDVERLDVEMRRLGEAQGPVRPDSRLPGLPPTHWWWWYPDPPPVEAAARGSSSVAKALRMTEERLACTPPGDSVHAMLASLRRQLEFMQDTIAAGRKPTTEEKNSLTLGVVAVREFEDSDPLYCDALTRSAFEFKNL